jgi:hypothetical protein
MTNLLNHEFLQALKLFTRELQGFLIFAKCEAGIVFADGAMFFTVKLIPVIRQCLETGHY